MNKDIKYLTKRRKNQLIEASFEQLCNPNNYQSDSDEELATNLDRINVVSADSVNQSIDDLSSTNPHRSYNSDGAHAETSDGSLDPSLEDRRETINIDNNAAMYEEMAQPTDFKSDLRHWVLKSHVPRRKIDSLLAILRKHGHPEIPKDVRTLMETPKNACRSIQRGNGGEYMHFGLEIGLKRSIEKYFKDCPDTIYIHLNFDGVSLANSSSSKFWPILAAIQSDFYTTPFIVGLYHGKKDPEDSNLYLTPFVEEMENLETNGIRIKEKSVQVFIRAFVCDAPAKSMILKTKGHSGYFSCSKCIQEGEWNGCVVFPEMNNPLRTDRSFRAMENEEYHHGESILTRLNIDMVHHFALDYMHLVCLGVMKRLLQLWVKGPKDLRLRADSSQRKFNSIRICEVT